MILVRTISSSPFMTNQQKTPGIFERADAREAALKCREQVVLEKEADLKTLEEQIASIENMGRLRAQATPQISPSNSPKATATLRRICNEVEARRSLMPQAVSTRSANATPRLTDEEWARTLSEVRAQLKTAPPALQNSGGPRDAPASLSAFNQKHNELVLAGKVDESSSFYNKFAHQFGL
ncbi:MAG TPA: hypothetical protein VF345_10905 [Chthoniobacterales bacterium]